MRILQFLYILLISEAVVIVDQERSLISRISFAYNTKGKVTRNEFTGIETLIGGNVALKDLRYLKYLDTIHYDGRKTRLPLIIDRDGYPYIDLRLIHSMNNDPIGTILIIRHPDMPISRMNLRNINTDCIDTNSDGGSADSRNYMDDYHGCICYRCIQEEVLKTEIYDENPLPNKICRSCYNVLSSVNREVHQYPIKDLTIDTDFYSLTLIAVDKDDVEQELATYGPNLRSLTGDSLIYPTPKLKSHNIIDSYFTNLSLFHVALVIDYRNIDLIKNQFISANPPMIRYKTVPDIMAPSEFFGRLLNLEEINPVPGYEDNNPIIYNKIGWPLRINTIHSQLGWGNLNDERLYWKIYITLSSTGLTSGTFGSSSKEDYNRPLTTEDIRKLTYSYNLIQTDELRFGYIKPRKRIIKEGTDATIRLALDPLNDPTNCHSNCRPQDENLTDFIPNISYSCSNQWHPSSSSEYTSIDDIALEWITPQEYPNVFSSIITLTEYDSETIRNPSSVILPYNILEWLDFPILPGTYRSNSFNNPLYYQPWSDQESYILKKSCEYNGNEIQSVLAMNFKYYPPDDPNAFIPFDDDSIDKNWLYNVSYGMCNYCYNNECCCNKLNSALLYKGEQLIDELPCRWNTSDHLCYQNFHSCNECNKLKGPLRLSCCLSIGQGKNATKCLISDDHECDSMPDVANCNSCNNLLYKRNCCEQMRSKCLWSFRSEACLSLPQMCSDCTTEACCLDISTTFGCSWFDGQCTAVVDDCIQCNADEKFTEGCCANLDHCDMLGTICTPPIYSCADCNSLTTSADIQQCCVEDGCFFDNKKCMSNKGQKCQDCNEYTQAENCCEQSSSFKGCAYANNECVPDPTTTCQGCNLVLDSIGCCNSRSECVFYGSVKDGGVCEVVPNSCEGCNKSIFIDQCCETVSGCIFQGLVCHHNSFGYEDVCNVLWPSPL